MTLAGEHTQYIPNSMGLIMDSLEHQGHTQEVTAAVMRCMDILVAQRVHSQYQVAVMVAMLVHNVKLVEVVTQHSQVAAVKAMLQQVVLVVGVVLVLVV